MHAQRFQTIVSLVVSVVVYSTAMVAAGDAGVGVLLPGTAARLADATPAERPAKTLQVWGASEEVGGAAGVVVLNDACANAAPISGDGLFAFDNTTATQDGPSHAACDFFNQTQIDHDVWFCWTAPAEACTGNYVIETCGRTAIDSKMAVYNGCTCPPTDGNLIACQDDECGAQSRASFTAVPGQSYLIRLGTFPGAVGGAGDLSISCDSISVCTEPLSHCQVGDQSDALNSNRTSYRVAEGFTPVESGSIDGVCWWGTYLTPPPGSVGCQGVAPDAFVIRYLRDANGLPGTEIVSFSQESSTLLVEGPISTGLTIGGSAAEYEFHATHIGIPVVAGECIWVEITNQLTGCNWFWETSAVSDGRAVQDGLPTPPPNGFTADDLVVADLAFCMNVQIEQSGTGCLPPPPPNDNCADAMTITGVGTFAVDNAAATTDGPSHPACEASLEAGIGKDVWYRWTAPCDGKVLLRTCDQTEVDSKVAVYADGACPTAETPPLACNDDICGLQSMVVFNATAGHSYLLRVGTFPRAPGGTVRFAITCGPPDNASCPGTGSCCAATNGQGCEDEACCETVCACDSFCCNIDWDADCASHGFDDSGCGAIDLCGCGSVCGRPDAGDCCVNNGTPGCDNAACCEAVCACDAYCCDTEWDNNCAGAGFVPDCGAAVLCASLCTSAPNCPSGVVTFVNPPNGVVDARQPNVLGNPSSPQGFQTFTVTGPPGAEAGCWHRCETAFSGTPNEIANVIEAPAGTYTITLSRPITPGAVTTLTYVSSAGPETTGYFTFHPANVNGDTATAPADILELIDNLNGVRVPPLQAWQCDIDRNNACAPADILTEIDLLNGASGFSVWNGTQRPSAAGLCPQP